MAGHEKLLRIYNLEKPDAEPEVLPTAPDKLRSVAFLHGDQQLLTSYIDKPGMRYISGPTQHGRHDCHSLRL